MPTVEVTDHQRENFVNIRGENENEDDLEYPADDKIGYADTI